MENIGIDVHKVESQICILIDGGGVIERRIKNGAGAIHGDSWRKTASEDPQRGVEASG